MVVNGRKHWIALVAAVAALSRCSAWAAAEGTAGEAPSLPRIEAPPLPPGAESPVPLGRPLTLAEAIEAALRLQPQVILAQAQVMAARGATVEAESGYVPSITMSGGHTRSSTAGVGAVGGVFTTGGYTANVSGRQLLYDFGRTPAAVAQARRQQDAAEYALQQTRQTTINQVKQAYYTLLQDQRLTEVQRQNVADQRAHLDLARAQFEAGVAPRADVVRGEAAVSSAIVSLVAAQSTEAVARVNLNMAIGIDVRTPVRVEETEEAPPLPPEADVVAEALRRRPEVRQLEARVAAAEEALRVARANDRPALYLVGNYGLRGTEFPPTDRGWSYGVSLSWSLFEMEQTRGLVAQAKGNLAAAQANLAAGRQEVASQVVQAYLNVQTAEAQVAASAADVANAQENLRVATGRYAAGVGTYIDIMDAQTALVTAETSQVNARYSLSMARAALAAAIGLVEPQ
jgi:TolC family type I secretion outer membrane protein